MKDSRACRLMLPERSTSHFFSGSFLPTALNIIKEEPMQESTFTNHDQLPLFLNAEHGERRRLSVSISSAYELMRETGFPALRIETASWCPKKKFAGGSMSRQEVMPDASSAGQAGTRTSTTTLSQTRSSISDSVLTRSPSTLPPALRGSQKPTSAIPATAPSAGRCS